MINRLHQWPAVENTVVNTIPAVDNNYERMSIKGSSLQNILHRWTLRCYSPSDTTWVGYCHTRSVSFSRKLVLTSDYLNSTVENENLTTVATNPLTCQQTPLYTAIKKKTFFAVCSNISQTIFIHTNIQWRVRTDTTYPKRNHGMISLLTIIRNIAIAQRYGLQYRI
jgi:hypothetical protein